MFGIQLFFGALREFGCSRGRSPLGTWASDARASLNSFDSPGPVLFLENNIVARIVDRQPDVLPEVQWPRFKSLKPSLMQAEVPHLQRPRTCDVDRDFFAEDSGKPRMPGCETKSRPEIRARR